MSMGPHNRQNLLVRGADNALPSPHGGDDEFFDVLVLALKEVAGLPKDESPHRETDDLLLLLEENTRLRKLVVQLSNLLGDLPPFSSVTPISPQIFAPYLPLRFCQSSNWVIPYSVGWQHRPLLSPLP
jgi:hypothetical protein